MKHFEEFLQQKINIARAMTDLKPDRKIDNNNKPESKVDKVHNATTLRHTCIYCGFDNHIIYTCSEFHKLIVGDRF